MIQTDKPKLGIAVKFVSNQINNKEADKIFNEYHVNPHDIYWFGEHEDYSNVYVILIEQNEAYGWQEKLQRDYRIETANIFSIPQALTKGLKKKKIIRVFVKHFLIFPVSTKMDEFMNILEECYIYDGFSIQKTDDYISKSEFILTVPEERADEWQRALNSHPKIKGTMVFGETYWEE